MTAPHRTEPWPLVNREAELKAVEARAAAGRSSLIVGAAGTGRTRLLQEALRRLEREGVAVHQVHDLGALPVLLERHAAAAGTARAGLPVVFGVDGVHLLGEELAAGLAEQVREGRVLLLATAPAGLALPAAVHELRRARLVGEARTAAFDLAAAVQALRARLGSHVASDAAARLWEATGGNPLLLSEVTEQAVGEGTFRPVRGLWHWQGEMPVRQPHGRVAGAARRLLEPLDGEERELVATLALTGPVPGHLGRLPQLAAAAERLSHRGVVLAEQAGGTLRLCLAQPLCGQVAVADLPEPTAQALRRQLADELERLAAAESGAARKTGEGRCADGGGSSRGGVSSSGRASPLGGASASGGVSCSGGVNVSGGASALGGASPWGGASPLDGVSPSGRARRSGGVSSLDGVSSSGRARRSGGVSPLDGASSSGRASRSGEASLSDGANPAGGASLSAGGAALLRAARLRIEAGNTPPAALLYPAAEVALRCHDFGFAERLARLAVGPGANPAADPRATLLLGRALAGQGRAADAEVVLAGTDTRSPEALRARVRNLAWGLHRVTDAAALATRASGSAARAQNSVVDLLRDHLGDVTTTGDAVLRETSGSMASPALQSCSPLAAFAHVELGRPERALTLLDSCRTVAGWQEEARHTHHAVHAHAALAAGDDVRAQAALDRLRATDAPYDLSRRLRADVLRAALHRAAGRLPQALALLRRAAAVRDGRDWFITRPWVLAQLAAVLAESGQSTEATRTLIEVRLAARDVLPYPLADDHTALEEARVLGRSGDVPAAVRRANEIAVRAAEAQRNATALAALHLTARLGEAAQAAAQAAQLGLVDADDTGVGPLHTLRAAHIHALARRDADRLDDLAEQFAALGRHPLAAECAGQAHQIWRDGRRYRNAQLSLAACRGRLDACSGVPLPALPTVTGGPMPDADPATLTTREREVALLATSRLTNREIAHRLTVSVRTVENHLYRVYTKLRVTSRAGLADHFGPQLTHS
ncbi:LuxR C-terminal-related transcriptional regulator [Streptomyces sp. NPDC041068]|uniref:helix-turn-helix transcriptional regulator n=1 Tax=Streptomyces sp. NPDC041068 TaxID=3155130 RepID=UPI0033E95D83